MKPSGRISTHNDSPYFNQIIDFRNCRYQGSADIYTRRPYGRGMLLDENYLFVLSDWINGVPSGKSFAVYTDDHMFYGSLIEGRTNKLCAYKQPGKYTIFLKHFINENNLVIIDDYLSQSLLILYLNYKEWTKHTAEERRNKDMFVAADSAKNKYIGVVDHKVYVNGEQKWAIIEQYAKEKVSSEYRNYSVFVSNSFSSTPQAPLISSQSPSEYELSYQGSSIICKISKEQKMEQDYSIKMVGIYDEEEEEFQAFKRRKGKLKIEQFVRGSVPVTYENRPAECKKEMREFFMKSTIFYNAFVNTSFFYQIKDLFMAISHYVDYFLTNKYAETFLCRNSGITVQPHDHFNLRKIDKEKLKYIQEEVLKAAQKKSSPQKERIMKYCGSLYENQEGVFARVKRFPKGQTRKNIEDYNWLISNGEHTNKESFKQGLSQSLISFQASPKKKQTDRKKYIKQHPLAWQIRPLDDITSRQTSKVNSPPAVRQNLDELAQDLINIQSELKKQAPNTPTRFSKTARKSHLTAVSKMSTLKSSEEGNQQQIAKDSSPLRGRKSSKASWR